MKQMNSSYECLFQSIFFFFLRIVQIRSQRDCMFDSFSFFFLSFLLMQQTSFNMSFSNYVLFVLSCATHVFLSISLSISLSRINFYQPIPSVVVIIIHSAIIILIIISYHNRLLTSSIFSFMSTYFFINNFVSYQFRSCCNHNDDKCNKLIATKICRKPI